MMPERTYLEAISDGLVESMKTDDSVVIFGEGVDNITGVYGTVLSAFNKFGSERVVDTPLSENALTGIAIGASLNGIRPILFHQRNDFIMLTMDQLVNHAAKIKYFSGGKYNVPITIVSFVARKVGEGCQHSQSLQSTLAHIPGLKVFMPSNPSDARDTLLYSIHDNNPTIVLFHRDLFQLKSEVDSGSKTYSIPRARVIKSGNEVTLIGVSATARNCLDVSRRFEDNVVEVIDLNSIRPLNKATILDSVSKTGRLVVVDTGWSHFGLASEIIATVAENIPEKLKSKPVRIGMREIPAPASRLVETIYHPNIVEIEESIKQMLC